MTLIATIRKRLVDEIGQDKFDIWFDQSVTWSLSGTTLSLCAPNSFNAERLKRVYQSKLQDILTALSQSQLELSFPIDAPESSHSDIANASAQPSDSDRQVQQIKQIQLTPANHPIPKHRPPAGLLNLVVGPANQIAVSAAKSMLDRPGTISPLFIHGPSGSGKSHLLQSIWNKYRSRVKAGQAVYLTAEQFTTHFLESLQGNGLPTFRRKHRDVEVLIIDDIEFFVGKQATMIEFHYTVDTLIRSGKQLVFSAKMSPTEIHGLGSDLVARMSSGLVCGIESPDFSMRQEIAYQYCQHLGLQIDSAVLNMLVERVHPDARHIQGAINRIGVLQQLAQSTMTLEEADRQLADLFDKPRRNVRITDIEQAVCEVFGVDRKKLKSTAKAKSISQPRMLAMWLARKYTRAAYSEIGDYFGKRAHNTVISAQQRVSHWIENDSWITHPHGQCKVSEALRRCEAQFGT